MSAPDPNFLPVPQPLYAIRTHAEICWQDILGFIFGALSPISILGLVFALLGRDEAKKVGLKQHGLGTVGLIFSVIGCSCWSLFWIISIFANAASRY